MKQNKLTLLIIAYASFIILGLMDGLLGVAWPSLRETFGQPVDALGLLLAMSTMGHVTASLVNGRLITRSGISVLLILSAALLTTGALIEISAPVWSVVLLGGSLVGFGMGMLDAGMNTYAASHFRPRLLNWLHASFGVGATLGASLMTLYLTRGYVWRAGIGTIAAFYIFLLILFTTTRNLWRYRPTLQPAVQQTNHQPTQPFKLRPQTSPSPNYAKNRQTLAIPQVWIAIAIFFVYTGVEIGVGHWAFTLLTESRGVATGTAGLWATLYWGSFMVGRILIGFIESNLTRLVRLASLGAIAGVLLLALGLIPALNLVGLILIGVSIAPIFPALVALTPRRISERHVPNAIGFEIGAAGVGAAVVPAVAGVLGDSFGLEAIPLFILAAAVVLFLLHELLIRLSSA